jgi:hypothetical protein
MISHRFEDYLIKDKMASPLIAMSGQNILFSQKLFPGTLKQKATRNNK